MRLAVIACGDRHWAEHEPYQDPPVYDNHLVAIVYATLDRLRPQIVISGKAPGADTFAENWAKTREDHCEFEGFPAHWHIYKSGAGPIRNGEMAMRLNDLRDEHWETRVVAFHDDILRSRGTKSMLEIAGDHGFPRFIVGYDGAIRPYES